MGIFDYSGLPVWVKVIDFVCWGSLAALSYHYFTCGA